MSIRRSRALVREAASSILSQPATSFLVFAIVAGMCMAVVMTTGRTIGAERAVLERLDNAGLRVIVVRSDSPGAISASVMRQLAAASGVESVVGFGRVLDVENANIPGGAPVPLRAVIDDGHVIAPQSLKSPAETPALASALAAAQLGLAEGVGPVISEQGVAATVIGELEVPPHMRFLEPLLIVVPSQAAEPEIATLVVLSRRVSDVPAVADLLQSLLADAPPGSASLETSRDLVAARAAIEGDLGQYGRGTVLVLVLVLGLLVAANMWAVALLKRRDFGRRRALGATRGLIVGLLVLQSFGISASASALGVALATVILAADGSPLPGLPFSLAVGVLALAVSVAAAVPPAITASRRDPIRELRVP